MSSAMEKSQGIVVYFMGKLVDEFSNVKYSLRKVVSDKFGDIQTG